MVTYYDLRAAVSAMTTLQGTLVRNTPIEIHYSAHKTQDRGVNQVWQIHFGHLCFLGNQCSH